MPLLLAPTAAKAAKEAKAAKAEEAAPKPLRIADPVAGRSSH